MDSVKKVVVLGCLMAAGVRAAISISWNSPANTFYQPGGTTLIPNQSLFLAFWSPDTTVGFNPAAPESPLGGDIFLGARNMNLLGTAHGRITGYGAGDFFLESSYGLPPDAFVPGYVYIAFFNFPFASYTGAGSIPVGTYYGIAPTPIYGGPLRDADPASGPPPPPDSVDYRGISYVANMVVIPEPASALLLLIGSGAVCWFRRRRMLASME